MMYCNTTGMQLRSPNMVKGTQTFIVATLELCATIRHFNLKKKQQQQQQCMHVNDTVNISFYIGNMPLARLLCRKL